MKYLWQYQWIIYSITFSVLILIVLVGASSMWPPTWQKSLNDAATAEVERRKRVRETFSPSEEAALNGMTAGKSNDEPSFDEDDFPSPKIVAALLEKDDSITLISEITERRNALEAAALRRQVSLIENVAGINRVVHLWKFCALVNACFFVASGMKWFFPRSIGYLKRLYGTHITNISIVGAIVGIFMAYLKERPFATDASSLLSTVGNLLSVSFILALILSTVQLFHSVFVAAFELSPWRRVRNGALTGGLLLLIFTLMIFVISGKFSEWHANLELKVQDSLPQNFNTAQTGAMIMAALLFASMWTAWRIARTSRYKMSSRLYYAAFIPILLVMLVTIASALMNISPMTSLIWIKAGVFACALFLAAGSLFSLNEWIMRYRYLRTRKLEVKYRGFRWWALIAWASGSAISLTLEYIMRNWQPTSSNYVVYQQLTTVYTILTLSLMLSFIPGAIVTLLFFRRVHRKYSEVLLSKAPRHPLST
ncbi:hypothetical protein [Actinomyces oris]|uniref:Beta-carotene 15,15'-monooxygenase n=1 Tax=Actinomyces oris TaxID=544580 RepID=A0AAW8L6T7_9ACTO|nr:hypothetical protein [Actinomyces oris]MDR0176771.1 hypothetical protein [Actinomyces oris]